MAETNVYICADSTLTYGPKGGTDKIVPQALPIAVVKDEDEAKDLITILGRKAYDVPEADPRYETQLNGRTIQPGYGPDFRHYYSGPWFVVNDVSTVVDVRQYALRILDMIRARA